MGNTNSAIAQQRAETRQRSFRTATPIAEDDIVMNEPQSTRSYDQRECTIDSTAVARKRSRFTSLRNPFRTREPSPPSTRLGADAQDIFQRRSRTELFSRRRRTRSAISSGLFTHPPVTEIANRDSFLDGVSSFSNLLAETGSTTPAGTFVAAGGNMGASLDTPVNPSSSNDIATVPGFTATAVQGNPVSPAPDLNDPQRNLSEFNAMLPPSEHAISGNASAVPSQRDRVPVAEVTSASPRPLHPVLSSDNDRLPSRSGSRQSHRSGEFVSPMPGEDQAGMLSRLLSVAAAATAASLVGTNNQQALRDAREVAIGPSLPDTPLTAEDANLRPATSTIVPLSRSDDQDSDLVDGSFDGFLAALQSGRLAQALRNGGNVMGGGVDEVGSPALNFFRMFRFSNAVNIEGSSPPTEGEGRQVPIIIVGIRSVPSRDDSTQRDGAAMPPFLDALGLSGDPRVTRPPIVNLSSSARQGSADDLVTEHQASGVSALRHEDNLLGPARTSTTGAHISQISDTDGPETTTLSPLRHADSTSNADSDAMHLRPPETPHASGESSSSSARSGPRETRRTNRPISGIMESVMDRLRSFRSDSAETEPSSIESRRRRRPSWRPFSNGDTHDDDDNAVNATGAATRSWIIYVLGGNYPENHPLLTTPSLFSDSPTYEDMLLLSNLIGPAKPETAATTDLESAGPTYIVSEAQFQLEERCQVCLGNYEIGETCRKLIKCSHYYHQECIDEWLTTGRNNCPLCRSGTAARAQSMTEPVP